MKNGKDVVVGLGEIGLPILKLLSRSQTVIGYDTNPKLMSKKQFNIYQNLDDLNILKNLFLVVKFT